jgi:tetratricopeptide (TPR) repeat protein
MRNEMMGMGNSLASQKSVIAENAQQYLATSNWRAAILEMEKLFAIDRDPHVRVRIGDARRKLNQHRIAIREYVRAAELFAANGFVDKALAQYTLIVRLDSSNKFAWAKMNLLRATRTFTKLQREPIEYRIPQSSGMVIAQFQG